MNTSRHRRPVRKKAAIVPAPVVIVVVVLALALFIIGQIDIYVGNVRVNYGEPFVDDMKATWFGFDVTKHVKVDGNVNTNELGVYSMKYSFLLYNIGRTVTVEDMQAPVIKLNGDQKMTLATMDDYQELGVEVWDNYDGDLSSQVMIDVETIDPNNAKVVYTIFDTSGHMSSAVREIEIAPGTVYLTFDDGPSGLTGQYLDTLKRYGVNATFFILGFSETKEAWKANVIRRAIDEGNEIGMHGLSHVYKDIYQSVDTAVDNFNAERDLLKRTVNIEPNVVRFPGGSSNTVSKSVCEGVMTEATQAVVEKGYNYFDWNVDSNDSGSDWKNSENIYNNVINAVIPKVGSRYLVLMHDGGADHNATLEALPKIIETLQEKGFKFEVLTYDTEPIRHRVNN